MLFQLLVNHPEAIVQILKNTPTWVWGMLTGLIALGISQMRDRTQSLVRVSIVPIGMTAFAAWGMFSAFGSSPQLEGALAAWIVCAAIVAAIVSMGDPGARYDAVARTYALPGSYVPMMIIVGIFLTKYAVGVEVAMQPFLVRDASFALPVAALYGVFNGIFAGRALRLWKLAYRSAPSALAA